MKTYYISIKKNKKHSLYINGLKQFPMGQSFAGKNFPIQQ